MESQQDQQKEGVQGSRRAGGAVLSLSCILRMLAISSTLVAATVMGQAKETKTILLQLIPTLPPFAVPITAKWSYSSAFVYFVVVNAIACFYSTLSLVTSFVIRSRKTKLLALIPMADAVAMALLFSATGAAAAIGVVGEKGVSRVGWKKVCNDFGGLCGRLMSAIGVSLVGCLVYLCLVIASLNNKYVGAY